MPTSIDEAPCRRDGHLRPDPSSGALDDVATLPCNVTSEQLDLTDVEERSRFEAWRTLTDPFFEVRPTDKTGSSFGSKVTTLTFDETLLIRSAVSGLSYHRSAARARSGNWDQVVFQIYQAGSFVGDYDGQDIAVEAGDINVIDFTRPYAKVSSDEVDINLIVPRAMVARLHPRFVHGTIEPGGTALGRLLGLHLDFIARVGQTMTAAEAGSAVEGFVIAMSGSGFRDAKPSVKAGIRATARARAARYVAAHLLKPDLGPDRIAKACGLSRASLFRIFAADGGVRNFIVAERLKVAFDHLRQHPSVPIQALAEGFGFSSEAQFVRRFRLAFGCSPGDVDGRVSCSIDRRSAATAPAGWLQSLRDLRDRP